MSDLIGRYPFSTADGKAIPLDIIRPEGTVSIDLLPSSGSSAFSLSSTIDCFAFRSNVDCFIKFAASGASASVPANATFAADTFFLYANTIVILSPPIDKRSISAIAEKNKGTLYINYLQTWSGLALKNQEKRR